MKGRSVYEVSALVLVVIGLPLVFYLPFAARRGAARKAGERMDAFLRRAPRRVAFYPLEMKPPQDPSPDHQRRICILQGTTLCATVIAALLLATLPVEASKMYTVVRNTLLGGVIVGGVLLVGQRYLREARTTLRCGRLLHRMGLSGLWLAERGEDQPLVFRNALFDSVHRNHSLDAVACSGLSLLKSLSNPGGEPLAAPHPVLYESRVRLLLVPPRSRKIDPERKRCSCAETALARLERRPEQHWRDLRHVLDVRNDWEAKHGVNIEVRFLEDRPAFQAMIVGRQAWFRPWAASGSSWLEVTRTGHSDPLHEVVRDTFANAWGNASEELCVSLSAGPSGSVFLSKGVEVDEEVARYEEQALSLHS